MTLKLYAHPFSSYCQKALIALYEKGARFDYRMLEPDDQQAAAELAELWPLKRFPVLTDGDRVLRESSIIIEYLDIYYPGKASLIPEDATRALEVRFMDRFFDNYIMTPMQNIVANSLRPEEYRDPYGVDQARRMLDMSYPWLEEALANRHWATGDNFTLADCAAAPSLFYADWVHPVGEGFPAVRAYRQRLLGRPSFARAVEEARPYRSLFPLGAPDRD